MSSLMVKEEGVTTNLVAEDNRGFMCFTNISEAIKYSEIISKSQFCPKPFVGKAGDVLVAIQFGLEVGLKPIQALQNICVINGKPSIYGDVAMALCRAHHSFEYCNENFDKETNTAICILKRKGEAEHRVTFSFADAKKAKLFGKPGPWQDYPERMCMFRARGFGLRDKYADVLKGLITREEANDYPANSNNVRVVNSILKQEPSNADVEKLSDGEAVEHDIYHHIETGEILRPIEELKCIIEINGLDNKVSGWLEYFGVSALEELKEGNVRAILKKIKKEIKDI